MQEDEIDQGPNIVPAGTFGGLGDTRMLGGGESSIKKAGTFGGLGDKRTISPQSETLIPEHGNEVDDDEPKIEIRDPSIAPSVEVENCGFGTLVEKDGDWFITGGVVTAGPANHEVEDIPVVVGADSEIYWWIDVELVANSDSGVLLPGILSSAYANPSSGTSYPDTIMPEGDDPQGHCRVPLGLLVVVDEVPTFRQDGPCTPIVVSHCPGQLSYV